MTVPDTDLPGTTAPLPPSSGVLHAENVFASSVRPEPALHAAFAVGSQTVTGVLDTGSGRSMIARHLVMDNLIRPSSEVIHSIGGRELYPVGCADVAVVLHGVSLELTNCLVLDSDMAVVALVVGCDALERHELCLDFTRRSVTGRHADGSQWTLYLPIPLTTAPLYVHILRARHLVRRCRM